jgi:hypothetical protein
MVKNSWCRNGFIRYASTNQNRLYPIPQLSTILVVIDDIEEAVYLQRKVDAKSILNKMNKIEEKLLLSKLYLTNQIKNLLSVN